MKIIKKIRNYILCNYAYWKYRKLNRIFNKDKKIFEKVLKKLYDIRFDGKVKDDIIYIELEIKKRLYYMEQLANRTLQIRLDNVLGNKNRMDHTGIFILDRCHLCRKKIEEK